jgi:hypothetical protein
MREAVLLCDYELLKILRLRELREKKRVMAVVFWSRLSPPTLGG